MQDTEKSSQLQGIDLDEVRLHSVSIVAEENNSVDAGGEKPRQNTTAKADRY